MTRRRQLRCVAAAATLAVGALLCEPTITFAQQSTQQEQGPVVFGQKQQTNWLTLEKTRGEFDLLYRYRNDEIDPRDNTGKSTFKEKRFEETLTLEGVGSIYHPNLIELDPLSATFGLFQDDSVDNGQSDYSTGTLYEWNLNATMLRKEDFVPTLYTRRTRQLVDRTFGPTLESTLTTYGAVLDIRKQAVPTRIEVYHTDEDQVAPGGDTTQNFNLKQDALVWHSEHRPSEHQVFNWDYTYNKVEQSTAGVSTNFDLHDATLSHSIDFGDKDRHNLNSSLHYFKQSGDINVDQFRWDELLRLRHTDTFETHYQYTLDKNSFSGTEQTVNRVETGFTHKLFKSLVTDGNIGYADTSGSEANQLYFANLSFDYHKIVPYGRLTGGAGISYTYQNNEAQSTATHIVDQPHTFIDGQPIILAGNNVDPNSIIVTDTSNIIVYVNGLDYTVTTFPTNVQINRVIGGRITDGQTVLIDYRLRPQPANQVSTLGYYANLRYDIEHGPLTGLGLYGRFANQNQDIASDSPSSFIDNSFTDVTIGTDYRFWLMKVGVEQQWHESTIAPFDATRFFARLDKSIGLRTTFSLDSTYDIIDYKDENNHVEDWITSATLQYQFTARLWGSISLLYQDQRDDLQGATRGWEEQAELQWRYRQTYVYGLLRNSNLKTESQTTSFQFFELGLRREF